MTGTDIHVAVALHDAVRKNDPAAITALAADGADLGAEFGGETALHRAAKMNRRAAAQALIDAGAPLESRTDAGLTPLTLALALGHNTLAEALLDAGADTAVLDKFGKSVLDITRGSGNTEGLKLLYRRLKPDELLEESHRVIADEDQAALAVLVEDAGASLTAKNSRGRTLLEEAELSSQFGMAAYLEQKIATIPEDAARGMREGATREVKPLKTFTLLTKI